MNSITSYPTYKLDKLFTEDYFYKQLPTSPILKITNLQEFLFHYKDKILEQVTAGEHLDFETNEIYTAEFFFNDNQFYKISWNISKAKEIIAENNLPIIKMNLSKLSKSIFEKDLTYSHLEVSKHNNTPIIVAFY